MGQNLSYIVRKDTKQLIFNWGQMQFFIVQPDTAGSKINFQRAIYKNGAADLTGCLQIQPPLRHAQASQKLITEKGIRSDNHLRLIQCFDLIGILTAGTQNDDG